MISRRIPEPGGQSGNVLFLILIAVALFAALSYAVTRVTKVGASGGEKEISSLNSSELAQYSSIVGVAIGRMTMRKVPVTSLSFNPPDDFPTLTEISYSVFHPQGGGATYQYSTPNMMLSGAAGTWHYNMEFEIDGIGQSVAGSVEGNELIAFLPGLQQHICASVNSKHDIAGIPQASADLSAAYTIDMEEGYTPPAVETVIGFDGSNGTDILTGHPTGCFRNNGGEYVFYYALMER